MIVMWKGNQPSHMLRTDVKSPKSTIKYTYSKPVHTIYRRLNIHEHFHTDDVEHLQNKLPSVA